MDLMGRSSARLLQGAVLHRPLFRQLAFAFLTSVCWLWSVQCPAESVRGAVTGPGGAVSAADLLLLSDGRAVRTTTVDANGTCQFENVSPGVYQIQVTSPPLLSLVREFLVSAGQDLELQLVLSYLSDGVTVTAARLPVPAVAAVADVQIMTADDLREMPVQSFPKELRLVLTGRFVDQQFDNDLNSVVLPSFVAWDAHVSRPSGVWLDSSSHSRT
jgi:hypothetical protein